MQSHYLHQIFNPTSIAVIGASDRPNSVGMKVFYNLLKGNFSGALYPINPKHHQVQGHRCSSSVDDIDKPLDLAVITTPARTVPAIMKQCGEKGIKAAIIISAGFSETGKEGKALEQTVQNIAHEYKMRFIGPNCLGVMRPSVNMNATFDNNFALPGNLALVSQSGALCAGILDWAIDKQIGFSSIVSLGNANDVDFGDILNFLAHDPKTQSILLYIEGVHNARQFMSGLRTTARIKPVIAIKAGRHPQGSRAALSHTGALIGDDDVFNAALERAGAIRVRSIEDLFSAAQILSSNYRVKGNRLTIITNGGGAGVMAADSAYDLKVSVPELSASTIEKLNEVLPANWSHHNPVDIIGDATPDRYHAAIDICLKDENIDGILALLVPVAMSKPLKVAKQIIEDAKSSQKPILASWLGHRHVKSARNLMDKNHLPNFHTPEMGVEAFSYLVDYQHNQQLLLQVPEPSSFAPIKRNISEARLIIDAALAQHRKVLTASESKKILKIFSIPVAETIEAATVEQALSAAEILGYPVVLKINSPDITHKQDVGGVALNIFGPESVREMFHKIIENAKTSRPNTAILGVTVERMFKTPNDRELMIGVIKDIVFGPVISFGAGGTLVEVLKDRSLALPPLNHFLAQQLIAKTRISKILGEFRHMPAVDLEKIINVILSVSEMVCELPYIQEMDINPLIVNEKEIIAVDARMVIEQPVTSNVPYSHMAIHPYPNYLISTLRLVDGKIITIRPIRPEDAELEQTFIQHLSEQSKFFRFMAHLQTLTPEMLVRFTQIDYDQEMSFIAIYKEDDKEICVGVAHYITNPDFLSCEFAIMVADEWHNKRIGSELMMRLINVAKAKGLKNMIGMVLASNTEMLKLADYLGFKVTESEDPTIKMISRSIQ